MAEKIGTSNIIDHYDLDLFRNLIQELYIDQGRSLDYVMDVLSKKGCQASRSMYLRKIRAWKMNKNQRRQPTITDPQTRPDQGGACRTISSPTGQPQDQDLVLKFFQSIYDLQSQIISSTEKHLDINGANALFQFYESLHSGIDRINMNDIKSGVVAIERGLRVAEPMLKEMQRGFLHSVLQVISKIAYWNLHELAHIVIKFIYQLSWKILGTQHALTRIFQILFVQQQQKPQQHQQEQQEQHYPPTFDLAFRAIRVTYDSTTRVLGKHDKVSLNQRAMIVGTLRWAPMSVATICREHEAFIKECDLLQNPVHTIGSRRNYAIFLSDLGRYPESISILREVQPALFQEPPSSEDVIITLVQVCYELAELIMKEPPSQDPLVNRQRHVEAEEILKMTVERSILLLGPDSYDTVLVTQALADFYAKNGDPDQEKFQRDIVDEQLAEFKLD